MSRVAKGKRNSANGRNKQYRRSVFLERDNNGESPQFILTECAQRALTRILEGVTTESGSRAWTITGPYGTGKSSFCLHLSKLLARDSSTSRSRHPTDIDVSSKLNEAIGVRKRLAPVLVTGSREPLAHAILRAFSDALRGLGSKLAISLAEKMRRVQTDKPRDVIYSVEEAVRFLAQGDASTVGVLLILDELGKFLEFAAANGTQSDIYLLQQLAEISARSDFTFVLVGVLHHDFSGYAKNLPAIEQQEWEKIRGRFEDIAFEQAVDDMLRLIAASLSLDSSTKPNQEFRRLCDQGAALGFVPNAPDQKSKVQLLTDCYPLHPAAAVLLAPVFKRFGQNERSAFSFLRSAEPFGFPDFVSRAGSGAVYRLIDLYQYLVAVYGDALLATKDGKKWAEALNVEALHSNLTGIELDTLRTIGLLGIVGRWYGILPTIEAISLALAPDATKSQVEKAIQGLLDKSAIIHRKFNDTFNLWEGSDIDVEARLLEARAKVATDDAAFRLIRSHFSPRPLVARRHSYTRGTLRYFDVIPVTPSTLNSAASELIASTADGHIFVLIPDSVSGSDGRLSQNFDALAKVPNVLLCLPETGREIAMLAGELAAIVQVERSTPELQSDPTARRELAARHQEVRRNLEAAMLTVLAPKRAIGQRIRWLLCGKEREIRSQRELNEWLSQICDEIYRDSPTIQNEIINRQELSSSAAAAQGELLKAMVSCPEKADLGIEGNPPQRSVYLSVLHRLGLHQQTDEGWRFAPGLVGTDRTVRPLITAIKHFFDGSRNEAQSLDKLFSILRSPPFGARNGVIPIFVCAGLLAHDAEVALYENGAFVPELTEPLLEKLVKCPNQYTVRQWQMAGVRTLVFEQLANMLQQSASYQVERRDVLNVVRPLLKFARRLNEFCKSTKTFSPSAVAVREFLLNASQPDKLLFQDLPQACEILPFSASDRNRDQDVLRFRQSLQNALAELQRGYDNLLQTLHEQLGRALGASPGDQNLRKTLTARAAAVLPIALNSDAKVFCRRLADTTSNDQIWIESVASFLTNKHPAQWNDDDRARMTVRLSQLAASFSALEALVVARSVRTTSSEDESIHLAVVGTQFGQTEHVIHISPRDRGTIEDFERKIKGALNGYGSDGQRNFLIAALASVIREYMVDSSIGEPLVGEEA